MVTARDGEDHRTAPQRRDGQGQERVDRSEGAGQQATDQHGGGNAAPEPHRLARHTGHPAGPQRRGTGVGRRAGPGAAAGPRAGGHDHQRQQPEEHPAPAGVLAHQAGQAGSEDTGQHPGGGDHGEHPDPGALGVGAPDGGVDDRRRGPRAEALQRRPATRDRHRGGRAAHHEARGERRRRAGERPGRAEAVGQGAAEQHADDAAQEERREGGPVAAPAEVIGDLGHDRGHGEGLGGEQRDRQHQAGRQPPPSRAPHAVHRSGTYRRPARAGPGTGAPLERCRSGTGGRLGSLGRDGRRAGAAGRAAGLLRRRRDGHQGAGLDGAGLRPARVLLPRDRAQPAGGPALRGPRRGVRRRRGRGAARAAR